MSRVTNLEALELTAFEWGHNHGRFVIPKCEPVAVLVNPENDEAAIQLWGFDQTASHRPAHWIRVTPQEREQWKKDRVVNRQKQRTKAVVDKRLAYRVEQRDKIMAAGGDDGFCIAIKSTDHKRCSIKHTAKSEFCRNHSRLIRQQRDVITVFDDRID